MGEISTTGPDGTVYRLTIPAWALYETTAVTITPILNVANIPLSGNFLWGVHFEPEGLHLIQPAELSISPITIPDVTPFHLLLGGFGADGKEYHLRPFVISEGELKTPIVHFSGAVAGEGNDRDIRILLLDTYLSAANAAAQQVAALVVEAGGLAFSPEQMNQLESIFGSWLNHVIDGIEPAKACGLDPYCGEFGALLGQAISLFAEWYALAQSIGVDQESFIQQGYQAYFAQLDADLLEVFNYRDTLCVVAPTAETRCNEFDDLAKIVFIIQFFGRDVFPVDVTNTMCGSFAWYAVESVQILGWDRVAPANLGCVSGGEAETLALNAEMEMLLPGAPPADFFETFSAGWRWTDASDGHVVDWDLANPLEAQFGGGEAGGHPDVTFWVNQCKGEVTDTTTVHVVSPLASLVLSVTDLTLRPHESEILSVTPLNSRGEELGITCFNPPSWSQDSTGTVSVTPDTTGLGNGLQAVIEGLDTGQVTLGITVEDGPSAQYKVTVTDISEVNIQPPSAVIAVGEHRVFQAIVKDSSGDEVFDRYVAWFISGTCRVSWQLTSVPVSGGTRSAMRVTGLEAGVAYLGATVDFVQANTATVSIYGE